MIMTKPPLKGLVLRDVGEREVRSYGVVGFGN